MLRARLVNNSIHILNQESGCIGHGDNIRAKKILMKSALVKSLGCTPYFSNVCTKHSVTLKNSKTKRVVTAPIKRDFNSLSMIERSLTDLSIQEIRISRIGLGIKEKVIEWLVRNITHSLVKENMLRRGYNTIGLGIKDKKLLVGLAVTKKIASSAVVVNWLTKVMTSTRDLVNANVRRRCRLGGLPWIMK